MMSLVTLMPVNFWIKERINQEAMIPIRPIIAEVRVEPAAATAFSSPPPCKSNTPDNSQNPDNNQEGSY